MYRRIKNSSAAILFMVLCFCGPLAAIAQKNVTLQGGSPAMNYSRELLKRADVQKELGIDLSQEEALAKSFRKWDQPVIVRPIVNHRDISKLSDEERKQWHDEIGRQSAEQTAYIFKERRREMEGILRPDQRKRLTEIDLQWRGILALVDRSLSDKLSIHPSHYKLIQEIVDDFEVKRIGLLRVHDRADLCQKRQVLLHETEQKILNLLSDEENARWSLAIGEPFKFEDYRKK